MDPRQRRSQLVVTWCCALCYGRRGRAGGRPIASSRCRCSAGLPDTRYTLQVYAEDCTGCGLCVEACPVTPIDKPDKKAINLEPVLDRTKQRANVDFYETLPRRRAAA